MGHIVLAPIASIFRASLSVISDGGDDNLKPDFGTVVFVHDDDLVTTSNHQPAEDRLWRHPSERTKHPVYEEQDAYYDALRRARRTVMITAGTVVGLSLGAALLIANTMSIDPSHRLPTPSEVATVSVTTAPTVVFVNATR